MVSTASIGTVASAISLVTADPLDPAAWQRLLDCLKSQKDSLSIKSLEIIIEGLTAYGDRLNGASANNGAASESRSAQSLFIRLASSYNDPKLFKEIGRLYLDEWKLPFIAFRHFQRAQRLGGSDTELSRLVETSVLESGKQAGELVHTGLRDGDHAHPVVTEAIRSSGRLANAKVPANKMARSPDPTTPIPETAPLPASPVECLRKAEQLLATGQIAQVQALLLKANDDVSARAQIRHAWSNLGMACYQRNAFPEMETAYFWARHYDKKNFVAAYNLALAQQLLRKFKEAEAGYLLADTLEPNHAKIWCNLSSLYFQQDDYVKSETAARKAVETRPDYARAWDNLGAALGAQNKLDEALHACREAVRFNPDYRESHFKIGMILFGTNKLSEAMVAFQQAVHAPAIASYAYAFIAIIQARLENTADAAQSLQQVIERDPKCDLLWMGWNELGHAYYILANYPDAVLAYTEATIFNPQEAEAWLHRGLAHHALRDRDEAKACYQKAIELNPDYSSAWHNLGIVHAEQEMHAEATIAFETEVRLNPASPLAWHDLGVSLSLEGKKKEALAAYTKADALTLHSAASI